MHALIGTESFYLMILEMFQLRVGVSSYRSVKAIEKKTFRIEMKTRKQSSECMYVPSNRSHPIPEIHSKSPVLRWYSWAVYLQSSAGFIQSIRNTLYRRWWSSSFKIGAQSGALFRFSLFVYNPTWAQYCYFTLTTAASVAAAHLLPFGYRCMRHFMACWYSSPLTALPSRLGINKYHGY